MKQYLISVFDNRDAAEVAPADLEKIYADVEALNQEIREAGAWVFAGGLHPPATATVLNGASGEVVTTDGPYLESKEHIGGFWIINVEDLDAALAWARKATVACRGPVEVRPFQDEPGA